MQNRLQSVLASALALCLGVAMVMACVALSGDSLITVSPFAITALVLIFGMIVSASLGASDLAIFYPNLRTMIPLTVVGGMLLFTSTFALVMSIKLGGSVLMLVSVLAISPILSGLWRRGLWLEKRDSLDVVALIVSHLGIIVWFTKAQVLAFGFAYFSAHFWAMLMTLLRPQHTSGASGAVWTWVSIFAGLVGLPVLWGLDEAIVGSRAAELLGARHIGFESTSFFAVVLFGSIMNAARLFVGIRSRKIFGGMPLSLLWVVGMIGAAVVLTTVYHQLGFNLDAFVAVGFSSVGLAVFAVAEYRRAKAILFAAPDFNVPSKAPSRGDKGLNDATRSQIDSTTRITHLLDGGHRLWSK